jgi:hypothetical protein
LPVDDSSDCIIRGSSLADVDTVDFDSHLVASTAAVSDGTRFCSSRRPVVVSTVQPRDITSSLKSTNLPSPTLPSVSDGTRFRSSPCPVVVSTVQPRDSTSSLESTNFPSPTLPLSTIMEDTPQPLDTSLVEDPIHSTNETSVQPSSPLSDTQIKEILHLVTTHLQQYGKITPELLNLLKIDSLQPQRSTSSTPSNHPILLSSDKMSNTAPNHMRYTVQQLSQYFGFCSFKNWEVLHDVFQPISDLVTASLSAMESYTASFWLIERPVIRGFIHLNLYTMILLKLRFNNGWLIVGGVHHVFTLISIQKFWMVLLLTFFAVRTLL